MIAVTTMQLLKFALLLVALFAGPAIARAWQRVAARPPRIEGDKLVGLRVRLEFEAVGLRGRRALTGDRELRWQEIAVVRYSRLWKRLTITDGGGREVSVSSVMPGFRTLLDQLRRRVPEEIAGAAVDAAALDPVFEA